jgi:hypothetical protein
MNNDFVDGNVPGRFQDFELYINEILPHKVATVKQHRCYIIFRKDYIIHTLGMNSKARSCFKPAH